MITHNRSPAITLLLPHLGLTVAALLISHVPVRDSCVVSSIRLRMEIVTIDGACCGVSGFCGYGKALVFVGGHPFDHQIQELHFAATELERES